MSEFTSKSNPSVPCLALRPKEAAMAIGISERKLSDLLADQTSGIPHLRFGKAVLFPIRELTDWLGQQASGVSK